MGESNVFLLLPICFIYSHFFSHFDNQACSSLFLIYMRCTLIANHPMSSLLSQEIVPPCRELVLNEGQKIVFTCTGNIEMAEPSLPLVFNSFVASARIVLYVHVKDPMEQQLHKYYR